MPEICALVDYDNQRLGVFRSGRHGATRASFRDHQDYLQALIKGLLDYRTHPSHRIAGKFAELRIRLYGGWLDAQGQLTEMADMVVAAIANIGRTRRVRNTRLFLELADRLLCMESEVFPDTFRKAPWLGARLRGFQLPSRCVNKPTCHLVEAALSWAGGRCPERKYCNAHTEDVFLVESQKLVDTMITSDAFLAHYKRSDEILTVSMDDDLVPGVLAVASMQGPVAILRFGKVNAGAYDRLLSQHGVPVVDYPALG